MIDNMRITGVTLIEAVVFIVIIAIAAAAILLPLALVQQAPSHAQNQKAVDVAQQRMELWLQHKRAHGFNNATSDPCQGSSSPPCDVPSGYNINTQVSNFNGNSQLKKITITISGEGDAELTSLIADY